MPPTIRAVRESFDPARPWRAPERATAVALIDAVTGAPARLSSRVIAYHDETTLYLLFDLEDDHTVATMFERDAPLYEEDVVECFIAPERIEEYFELEVSPRGTLFDARVVSPDRDRRTMNVDREWDLEGFTAAVKRDETVNGRTHLAVLLSLPIAAIAPRGERVWRANFYRVDRHPDGDEFLAWSPPLRTPADFHVPEVFGFLELE